MEVSLYSVGSAAAVGYCAGLLAKANPAASAAFVVITTVINKIARDVLEKMGASYSLLSRGGPAILCGAAVISYKITEKLVAQIATETLGKVILIAVLIHLAGS